MARFFHVDRTSALSADQVLGLTPLDSFAPESRIQDGDLQGHAEELFPDGLSNHGLGFLFWQNTFSFPAGAGFFDDHAINTMRSHAIDVLWEFVRRSSFPDRPSRYQSTFCWESREDASRFVAAMGATGAAIWEIEGDNLFRADMNLLTMGTALQSSLAAHRYWRGDVLPQRAPLWEVFVAPGARVLGRVV